MSWNNARSNASYPVFVDTYHGANTTGDPHCCWGDEIIAIGTGLSANNTVYRFAQHRSTQNTYAGGVTNFYDTPRGNISQDLGCSSCSTPTTETPSRSDPASGQYRQDVFIVHLDKDATRHNTFVQHKPHTNSSPPASRLEGFLSNPPRSLHARAFLKTRHPHSSRPHPPRLRLHRYSPCTITALTGLTLVLAYSVRVEIIASRQPARPRPDRRR